MGRASLGPNIKFGGNPYYTEATRHTEAKHHFQNGEMGEWWGGGFLWSFTATIQCNSQTNTKSFATIYIYVHESISRHKKNMTQ